MYFGKDLTRIHCHIVTLSFSLFSLFYLHSLALSLPLMHTNAHRQSNLMLNIKTVVIASRGGACYDCGQIEYVCWDQHCHKIKALQHKRSSEMVLVENIINQSELLS